MCYTNRKHQQRQPPVQSRSYLMEFISMPGVGNPRDNIAVSLAGQPTSVLSSYKFGQMSEP